MTLLIDADFIVYKCAASCETDTDFGDDVIVVQSNFNSLTRYITYDLKKISEELGDQDSVLFFSDSQNFRKKISPDYKGQRNRKKPCGYRRAIEWLMERFEVVITPHLEADDALGIYQTLSGSQHIVVSPDKDLRQIPGRLYNLKEPVTEITKEEGETWHLIQTLAGDQTDGYPGCPGIGVKKAEALFAKNGQSWPTVVGAFEKAGLTADDALLNARLAKILQSTDYDFDQHSVRLWNPSSEHGAEDRSGPDPQQDGAPASQS